jgi:uncharacterized Ntn-hydrolase superfamily protein
VTFSILARDPATGALGAAAATGNLCVGAWVLRGDLRAGLTASQGLAPNAFWGPDALARLRAGAGAAAAVAATVEADAGRAARQLAVLDRTGAAAVFDGAANVPWCGHLRISDALAAGNWIASEAVLEAALAAYAATTEDMAERLIAALAAGVAAGGDARGMQSAALLVLAEDAPPLDLRIDHDPDDPVAALAALHARTRAPAYRAWLATLPTSTDPEKAR